MSASIDDFKEIYRKIAELVDVIHEASKRPAAGRDTELALAEWIAEDVLARLTSIDAPNASIATSDAPYLTGDLVSPRIFSPRKNSRPPLMRPKAIVDYRGSDFVSLDEYITAMRRSVISDIEATKIIESFERGT